MPERETQPTGPTSVPDRIGAWVERHSYEGRYDEYIAQYGPYLEDIHNGLEGYELAIRLDDDAKRYAAAHVARDTVIAAATLGGVLYIGRETLHGRIIRDAAGVGKRVLSVPGVLIDLSDKAFHWTGSVYDSVRGWASRP